MLIKVLLVLSLILTGMTVEMKSFHRIGSRIDGDVLIVTDPLHSPTVSDKPSNHTISFRQPVTMIITCIEMYSNANVLAEFVLSYDSILHGVITAIDALEFELTVSVYGIDFKKVPENFNPPLTPKTQYRGMITWESGEDYEDDDYDTYDEEEENIVGTEIIIIGVRQNGDKIIYQDFQSSMRTDLPSLHEVTFRFIDSYSLTHVEFKTYDQPSSTAIFTHLTEYSIKAVIQAENATYLDVECKIYGFDPKDKPSDYQPLIPLIENDQLVKAAMCSGKESIRRQFHLLMILGVLMSAFRMKYAIIF